MSAPSLLRRSVPALAALALCVACGVATVRPGGDAAELQSLASRFTFAQQPLNSAPAHTRSERAVAPSLQGIAGWISAVGAAVALTDLRGLGRPADACLVDPRDDSVTVLPVPGAGGPAYPRFALTAGALRYDATMAPMGCVPADVNEDGTTDLVVYYWGRSPILFLNTAAPGTAPSAAGFTPSELVNPMQVWNSTALNVADVDGDGHLDIAVGNYFPDGAKVLDPTAAGDGRMAMQDSMGMARNAGTNRLYLLHPTGRAAAAPAMTDASTAFPADSAQSWTLSFGFQDLSGQHLPDLYVANDFGPDQMLVNTSTPGHVVLTEVKGQRDLTTPRSEVLGHDSFKGMGVAYSYQPGATMPDILVSNIAEKWALQESNFDFVPTGDGSQLLSGTLPYSERSEALGISRGGWAWDIKAGDFLNAGSDQIVQATGFVRGEQGRWAQLQELAMGNDGLLHDPTAWPTFGPGDDISGHDVNPFWVRTAEGRYADLAAPIGLAQPGVSRGIALGDVDGDGRLDALVANQWADSTLLRNTAADAAPAAYLRLVVPGAAGGWRDAIGAEIELRGGTGGTAVTRSQLYPANGHAGVSAAEAHLALPAGGGTATVTWRDPVGVHHADVAVTPGHHTIQLGSDGTAVTR